MPRRWAVAGIDLAWGERRPDGICLLQGEAKRVIGLSHALTHGDDALLDGEDDDPELGARGPQGAGVGVGI